MINLLKLPSPVGAISNSGGHRPSTYPIDLSHQPNPSTNPINKITLRFQITMSLQTNIPYQTIIPQTIIIKKIIALSQQRPIFIKHTEQPLFI